MRNNFRDDVIYKNQDNLAEGPIDYAEIPRLDWYDIMYNPENGKSSCAKLSIEKWKIKSFDESSKSKDFKLTYFVQKPNPSDDNEFKKVKQEIYLSEDDLEDLIRMLKIIKQS